LHNGPCSGTASQGNFLLVPARFSGCGFPAVETFVVFEGAHVDAASSAQGRGKQRITRVDAGRGLEEAVVIVQRIFEAGICVDVAFAAVTVSFLHVAAGYCQTNLRDMLTYS